MSYQEKINEMKLKIANVESLLNVTHKLCERAGNLACYREMVMETKNDVFSTVTAPLETHG